MRLVCAYADPPYIGQAKAHYGAPEVDHGYLIRSLHEDYPDGWALSFGATLREARVIVPLLPDGARLAAWVKPFASFKPGVNPGYCWEMVAFHTTRKRERHEPTVRDFVAANITLRKGMSGAKPEGFAFWLFGLLGLTPADTFVDVFTGSGAMGKHWRAYCAQARLFSEVTP